MAPVVPACEMVYIEVKGFEKNIVAFTCCNVRKFMLPFVMNLGFVELLSVSHFIPNTKAIDTAMLNISDSCHVAHCHLVCESIFRVRSHLCYMETQLFFLKKPFSSLKKLAC